MFVPAAAAAAFASADAAAAFASADAAALVFAVAAAAIVSVAAFVSVAGAARWRDKGVVGVDWKPPGGSRWKRVRRRYCHSCYRRGSDHQGPGEESCQWWQLADPRKGSGEGKTEHERHPARKGEAEERRI